MSSFISFFIDRIPEIMALGLQHIKISGLAVLLAILIGIPTGIAISKREKTAKIVLGIAGTFQTIPSLALFGLIIPILGIGIKPAIFVLFLYSLLPIVTNTYIGIKSVDNSTIQAAIGMGMANFQVLTRVKLPIAVAVIMGGIRISAVANIGTTTIASLIGAGGLGSLIFRGISISNNFLVLSGALPTAALVFIVNFALGIVEKSITPTGMLSNRWEKKKGIMGVKIIGAALLVLFGFTGYKSFTKVEKETIRVAHNNFTEQRIMGHMLSLLIENETNYQVDVVELGGSYILFEALKSSEIDMFPAYTGTAYNVLLGESGETSPRKVYEIVKKKIKEQFEVDAHEPMQFSNTYCFVAKKDFVEKYGIKSISDLKRFPDRFVISGTNEFLERPDGVKGVIKEYDLKFKDVIPMDAGLIVKSIDASKVDVRVAFSTDGLISKYNLVILEDDKNFFPPYNISVFTRGKFTEKHRDVMKILDKLNGMISNEEMQEMNLLVSEGVLGEREMAKKYLEENGYIR